MTFNPAPNPREPQPTGGLPRDDDERGAIARRVEAAARARAPEPKGRSLVMMILGVVVLGALIWDFTGRGSASRGITQAAGAGKRPVAPARNDPGGTDAPSEVPDGSFHIAITIGKATLSMSAADAVQRFGALAGEERETFRAQVLEALGEPAGRTDGVCAEAFEAAARFAPEAGAASVKHLLQLKLRALVALGDDTSAPAAILFLRQLPAGGGAETMTLLDEVILDAGRPLRVRIEAARGRSVAGRPAELDALAQDPATHPSLRAALDDGK